jgi:hypothetical protein
MAQPQFHIHSSIVITVLILAIDRTVRVPRTYTRQLNTDHVRRGVQHHFA